MKMKRPEGRSYVWAHFDKIGHQRVTCKLCKKRINFFGPTTNLLTHLRKTHYIENQWQSDLTAKETESLMVNYSRRWKYFYVVNFVTIPFEGIDEFVTVPHSWIDYCINEEEKKVSVRYPEETSAHTIACLKKRLKPDEDWRCYDAIVKTGADTYDEAEDWILKRQTYGAVVEERTPAPNMQAKLKWRKMLECLPPQPDTKLRKPLPRLSIRIGPAAKKFNGNELKSNKTTHNRTHVNKNVQPACSKWNQSITIQNQQSIDIADSLLEESFSSQLKVNQQQSSSIEEEQELNVPSVNAGVVKPIPNKGDQAELTMKQQPSSSQVTCQSGLQESIQEQNRRNQGDDYSDKELSNAHNLLVQPISTYNHMNVSQPIVRIQKLVEKPMHPITIAGNMITAPQNPSNLNTPTQKLLSLATEGQVSILAANQSQVAPRDLKMHPKECVESRIDHNTSKIVSVHDQPYPKQHQPSSTRRLVQQKNFPAQKAYLQHAIPDQVRLSQLCDTVQSSGLKELPASNVHSQPHPEMNSSKYDSRYNQNQYHQTNNNSFSQESFRNTNNYSYQHNHQAIRMGLNANESNMLQNQQSQHVPTSQGAKTKTTSHLPTSVPPKAPDSARQVLLAARNNYVLNVQQFQASFNQSVPNLENSLNVTANAGLTDQSTVSEVISPYFGEVSGSNAVMEHEVSADPKIVVDEASSNTMTATYGTGISTDSNLAERDGANTRFEEHRRHSQEQQILDRYASVFNILYTTLTEAAKINNTLNKTIQRGAEEFAKLLDLVEQFNEQNHADEIDMPPDRHATDDLPVEVPSQEVTNNEDQHPNDPLNKVLSKNVTCVSVPALPPEYDPNDTKWTLRHRVMRQGLVELMPRTGILVNSNELSYRVNESKDCKSLAQLLLPVVFNRNALGVCSTFVEKTQGVNVGFARPELDEYAMYVLLSKVFDHGKRFGWNDQLEPILHAVHNTMQEFRFEYNIATGKQNRLNLK